MSSIIKQLLWKIKAFAMSIYQNDYKMFDRPFIGKLPKHFQEYLKKLQNKMLSFQGKEVICKWILDRNFWAI